MESPSDRIGDCKPEAMRSEEEKMEECLVALFQVEEGDTENAARSLCRNLKNTAKQLKTRRVMISPFAHFSDSRPDPNLAKQLSLRVVEICQEWNLNGEPGWEIQSSHFGWNKSLLLDIKGHPNAFKHWSHSPVVSAASDKIIEG